MCSQRKRQLHRWLSSFILPYYRFIEWLLLRTESLTVGTARKLGIWRPSKYFVSVRRFHRCLLCPYELYLFLFVPNGSSLKKFLRFCSRRGPITVLSIWEDFVIIFLFSLNKKFCIRFVYNNIYFYISAIF